MTRKIAWHTFWDGDVYTLTRHVPVRFDVAGETILPRARPEILALQIRQDLWRALQKLRGFSPIVRITRDGGALHVKAGGRIEADQFPRLHAEAMIADVLGDPHSRSRWVRHATSRGTANA